jgi:hypothetical protein
MKHPKKSNGTKSYRLLLPVFLAAVVALILGATASVSWAWGLVFNEDFEVECGFEINVTDFDAGFYFCVDSEGWKGLQVYRMDEDNSNKQLLYWASTFDGLRRQGLTELCSESREPVGEVEQTLARFPEGKCKFIAKKFEYGYEYNTTELTHDFACPAENIVLDPFDGNEECVPAGEDLTISWSGVLEGADAKRLVSVSFDDEDPEEVVYECEPGEGDVVIDSYQVVFETQDDEDDSQALSFDPFDDEEEEPEVTVPGAFLKAGTGYKFEILVVEESGNRSIKEIEFDTCLAE